MSECTRAAPLLNRMVYYTREVERDFLRHRVVLVTRRGLESGEKKGR